MGQTVGDRALVKGGQVLSLVASILQYDHLTPVLQARGTAQPGPCQPFLQTTGCHIIPYRWCCGGDIWGHVVFLFFRGRKCVFSLMFQAAPSHFHNKYNVQLIQFFSLIFSLSLCTLISLFKDNFCYPSATVLILVL